MEAIDENRTFKITYADEHETIDIEYTCDSALACAEIVAKIKYLLPLRRVQEGWYIWYIMFIKDAVII